MLTPNRGQWHGLTSYHPINEVKQPETSFTNGLRPVINLRPDLISKLRQYFLSQKLMT